MSYLNIEEVFNGRYVVYKWSSRKYYLGTVTDVTSSSDDQYDITVSLMKKNTVRGNRVYFIWPTSPHVVVIDDLQTNQCLRSISVPMIDRRSILQFMIRSASTNSPLQMCIKAIGGVRVKIFILSYFKELHKRDQRLFTECQN